MTHSSKSQAERHARKIGNALAKGRPPAETPQVEQFIAEQDGAIFDTLEGFVAQAASAGGFESPLSQGYMYLLRRQLEALRFGSDRGYARAIGQIAEFQRAVAMHVTAAHLDGTAVSLVSSALHQAQIPVSEELSAALQGNLDREAGDPSPADLNEVLDAMVEACEGDVFQLANSLAESAHGLPLAVRAGIAAELAAGANATGREAAVLMLLDPDAQIRAAVIAALKARPTFISPLSLRRLIAMRNWRPEAERAQIDDVVRAARSKGVECAAIQPGPVDEILASGIDGAGAQSCLVLTPAGRRKSLSSILLKHGVRDAFTAEPAPGREVSAMLALTANEVLLFDVPRRYLDQIVCHHIQVGLEAGLLPPAGLLQVAEELGATGWNPDRSDWREVLAELLRAIPPQRLKPEAVARVLKESDIWAAIPRLADSWFEDDQDVARIVGDKPGRGRAKRAALLLHTVIERRREKWAELFCWTAHWLREGAAEQGAPWGEFAIVADALAKGLNLDRISLMNGIAMRTVIALARAA
jgi:hypothetical protein